MDDNSNFKRRIFECEFHRKPIIYLTIDQVNDFRKHKFNLFCEDCLQELKILSYSYRDTPDNFLTSENLNCFIFPLNKIKEQLEFKQNSIRAALSSFDHAIECAITFLNQFKDKVKAKLHSEFSAASDYVSKITMRHKQYQLLMQELLYGSTESATLQQVIELYSQLSAEINFRGFPDLKHQNLLQTSVQRCTEQLSELKPKLEDLFHMQDLNFNEHNAAALRDFYSNSSKGIFEPTRSKSIRTVRPSSKVSDNYFTAPDKLTERIDTQVNFMKDTLEAFNTMSSTLRTSRIDKKTTRTTRDPTPTMSPRLVQQRNTRSPLTQRNKVAIKGQSINTHKILMGGKLNCLHLETSMKAVDTMNYIPKIRTLVYAGSLKGQQFHSIIFYKIGNSPKISKIVDAHSHKITALQTCYNSMISCSKDALAKVWDLRTLECQIVLKHTSAVLGAAYDCQKNIVFTFGSFSNIRVWNLNEMTDHTIKNPKTNQLSHLYFLDSREWIIAAYKDSGRINILDYITESIIYEFIPTGQCVYNEIQFDHETNQILTVSSDGMLKVWVVNETGLEVNRVLVLREKGGYNKIHLAVDLSHELVFLSSSSDNLWVGKLTDERSDGILNWIEIGMKNIHQLIYLKKQQWVLASYKNDGKIAIVEVQKLKESFPELR